MVDELDEDVERAQSNIDLVTKKTADLIKKSGPFILLTPSFIFFKFIVQLKLLLIGGMEWFCIIIILTAVLVVLTILVIYS
jgi:hypothetical protein